MKIVFIVLMSVCLWMPASQSQAAVYQWVDDKGVVHFTDNADKIPSKYLNKVRERESVNGSVTVTPSTVQPGKQPDSGDTVDRAPVREDEGVWRSRFSGLREEKKQVERGLVAKKEKLATLRRKKATYGRGSDRTAYYDQYAEIERDETRIKELEQRLRDLDAEAGRAGVPLEWRQ
ncbi:DUF4124 domain-containing protein [Geotalea toluenoxydans]|uniref:DUF4124 domain-containing protein n=1 Tax=Geotalea toluenoxydans TaxID=421624 RepID=UPI0006D03EFD|nr:DUF4124 domain-containing protein [Geotalea toluenoxydans]